MAIIDYSMVKIHAVLVRFECSICGATWYVDNSQLDYQAFIGCPKCGVICEIEDDE